MNCMQYCTFPSNMTIEQQELNDTSEQSNIATFVDQTNSEVMEQPSGNIEQQGGRKSAYDTWMANQPVFVQGHNCMMMTNKTKEFWQAVADATEYKNIKTIQNRFRQTIRD